MRTKNLITQQGINGQQLITTVPITQNERIFDLTQAQRLFSPTYQTIQINQHEHIIADSLFLYLNHSCHPNMFVDTVKLAIYALVDIPAQHELTFFYPATEWKMAQPFKCTCGYKNCLGIISGAVHLSKNQLMQYQINPHILTMAQAL